ncbi:MAG: glutathione peroxidase [Cellvibrionaceae bacterium]|jgi:glutathione peroxidase
MNKLTLFLILCFNLPFAAAENCPEWLNHSLPKLHSASKVNLCKIIDNNPVLLVNTASYCGFTYQFESLQTLHKSYGNKGLVIIGFPSDDFRQEAKDEKITASICYENFGVEFTMVSPIDVKGKDAHPIFKHLAVNSRAPSWNFNKYLISADGERIMYFASNVDPSDKKITEVIDQLISER